jgi:hypothetical protein
MKSRARRIAAMKRGAVKTVLIALLLGGLCVKGLRIAGRFSDASRSNDTMLELDSFSEPEIAIAILNQHVEHLLLISNASQPPGRSAMLQQYCAQFQLRAASKPTMNAESLRLNTLGEKALPRMPATDQIRWLHHRVQMLNHNLNRELMRMHMESGNWNEFLDCYLKMLSEAPDEFGAAQGTKDIQVAQWTKLALDQAESCSRTDEILDALQHVIQFHNDVRAVKRLVNVLELWKVEYQRRHLTPHTEFTLKPL